MLNRSAVLLACILVSFILATPLRGQGRGQGAIVIRDTERDGPAPIYRSEDGDKSEARAARGDYVGRARGCSSAVKKEGVGKSSD